MPIKRTTPPVMEGRYRGVFKNDNILGTNWEDLKSENFYNLASGQQLPAGLSFSYIGIAIVTGSNLFLKYRAKATNTDSTDYTDGVLEVYGTFLDNPINLIGGSGYTTVISIKAGAATTEYEIIAGFDNRGDL